MPARFRAATAALGLTAALLLGGCGGGSTPASKAEVPPTDAASDAPNDVATTTAPHKTKAAVPSGGPTGIGTFPIPPGVKVKGPGPLDKSWQFDILTKDVAGVLAFYRKALPAAGYTVRNDVTKNVGAEVVTYDIAFSGPATGYLVRIPDEDDVFVVVQSPPDTSVSPDAQ